MATQADLLGVGHTLTGPDGETYEFKPPTERQQAVYQRWMERVAREKILGAVEYGAEDRARRLDALEDRIAAGVYEWGGDLCVQRLRSREGMIKLLEITLGVDELTARKLVEHRLELICALLAAKAAEDPKAIATIRVKLGLPPDDTESSRSSTPRGAGRRKRSERSPTPKLTRSSDLTSETKAEFPGS